jgi:broad specificity phosphatase PhoE
MTTALDAFVTRPRGGKPLRDGPGSRDLSAGGRGGYTKVAGRPPPAVAPPARGPATLKVSPMERPSLLVLVRHAESARNKAKGNAVYFADEEARKTVRGVADHLIPLTPEGVTQAERTGPALRERFGDFDYAYHSGYRRTTDTLSGLLAAYPPADRERMTVRTSPFIRERDAGYTYDMTRPEVEAMFPWLEEYWKTFGGFFAHPPGGESMAQVVQRVHLFLNMLFRDHVGQRILVVTHAGTLRCFRFLLEHWDYEQALASPPGQGPENCGVTAYRYDHDKGSLALEEYNAVLWR